MRFIDEDLEEEWEKESYPRNQQRGAVLLALVAFGLAVDRFYAFFELETCPGDEWWLQRSLQIGSILVLGKVFALLFAVPAVEGSRDSIRTFFSSEHVLGLRVLDHPRLFCILLHRSEPFALQPIL